MKKRAATTSSKLAEIKVSVTGHAIEDFNGFDDAGRAVGGGPLSSSALTSAPTFLSSLPLFTFRKGDYLVVSKLDSEGNGFGMLEDGRKGWFPLELIAEDRPTPAA